MQPVPHASVSALVGLHLVVVALEDLVMYVLLIPVPVETSSLLLVCWLAPFPVWVPPPLSGESVYCPSLDPIVPPAAHCRASLGNARGFRLVRLHPPL